jgi:hypothetical protein
MVMETIMAEGQSGRKLSKTPSQQNKASMVAHTYDSSYDGDMGRRIAVTGPRQKWDPTWKKQQTAGGMA